VDTTRTTVLRFRCSPEESSAIRDGAARDGLTVSSFIRSALAQAHDRDRQLVVMLPEGMRLTRDEGRT
jgi:uncharacterized protein (DUF1778 family)